MKRKFVLLTLIVMTFFIFSFQASAITNFGTLSYWYANTNSLGDYRIPNVAVFATTNGTTFPSATFTTAVNAGFSAWTSCEGISSTGGTATNYNWLCAVSSRASATAAGIPINVEA